MCRFWQTFFGLSSEHKSIIYEDLFALTFHGKISLAEAQRLPIFYRKWLIKRTIKEYEKMKAQRIAASKGKQ